MKKNETLSIQEQYLKTHKKHHRLVTLARFGIFIGFLIIWELLARLNIIDTFFFSSPTGVIKCAYTMILDLSLFTHIGVTLYETIFSFFLVIIIGIVVASTKWFEIPGNLVSTMVTVAVAIANLYLVYHLCHPWNKKRICMFAGILVAFFCAMSYAKGIFMFRDIPQMGHFILIGIAGMDFLLYHVYQYMQRKIKGRIKS